MITLTEAKTHLRVTGDDDDTEIAAMIETAQAHIENFTGMTFGDDVPAPVKSAAKLVVADLYENREAQVERPLIENRTFCNLLNFYRAMEA